MFLKKEIHMGIETCSRNEYPATECNFLFKLSIHTGMKHLGISTSFLRKHTWIQLDKNPKLIYHSEKSTFLCPFSAFATRCVFQHWAGAQREHYGPQLPSAPRPSSLTAPQGPDWESPSGNSLCFAVMCSAVSHYCSTTLKKLSSFSGLIAAQCLWTRLSFHRHRTHFFCQSSHTSPLSLQVRVPSLQPPYVLAPFAAFSLYTVFS